MIEKVKSGGLEMPQLDIDAVNTIYDYFQSELLGRLDEEARDFLLKTSILPFMDSRMSEQLTGVNRSGQILSELSRNNCFTERRFDKDPVYEYHSLFRKFLLSKARDHFGDEGLFSLKRKAALLLYESGRIEDAFELFRECSMWEEIIRLVKEHAKELMGQGRGKVLEKWITTLPGEMLEKYPWMLYWLGLCRVSFNPDEGRAHLEKAFLLFKEQRDAVGAFLCWSGIVDSLAFGLHNLRLLDIWIPMLDGLIKSFGCLPSEEIETRVVSSMFMALAYRQPQHPEIDFWGARALTLSQKCEDRRLMVLSRANYAFNKMRSGELEEAALIIDSLRPLSQTKNITPLFLLTMKWTETIYLTMTASHDSCLKVVSEALKLSTSSGVYIMDIQLMGRAALSALNAGDLHVAEGFLRKMASSPLPMRSCDQGFFLFLSAYNALLKRDLKKAEADAQQALKQAIDTGFPIAEAICHLENAHVMHELNKPDKAANHLKECLIISRLIKYRYMEFLGLLTEALFAFDNGFEEAGRISLLKGLAIGRECGFVNTYLLLPDDIARLCFKALQSGIEVEYVQEIIRKRYILPDKSPDIIENWPWPIKIFTLGRFSLVRDGKTIRFPRKGQQKPLAFLKALIALGGRDVKEDDMSDILWKEAEGDSAHKAFAITLHRLRRLLGKEAVSYRNGRIALDPHHCLVDIWSFEQILSKADEAIKEGCKEKGIKLIEKATSIYHGHFLEHDGEATWIESRRKRLKSKFLRNIRDLGLLYEERGELDKAINSLKKGIEIDPLAEELYQHLMTCYQKKGYRAEALAVYKDLKETLSSILGISPSQRTEEIFRSLTS